MSCVRVRQRCAQAVDHAAASTDANAAASAATANATAASTAIAPASNPSINHTTGERGDFYVKKSDLAGGGLFASRTLPSGHPLCKYTGIEVKAADTRAPGYIQAYVMRIGPRYIDARDPDGRLVLQDGRRVSPHAFTDADWEALPSDGVRWEGAANLSRFINVTYEIGKANVVYRNGWWTTTQEVVENGELLMSKQTQTISQLPSPRSPSPTCQLSSMQVDAGHESDKSSAAAEGGPAASALSPAASPVANATDARAASTTAASAAVASPVATTPPADSITAASPPAAIATSTAAAANAAPIVAAACPTASAAAATATPTATSPAAAFTTAASTVAASPIAADAPARSTTAACPTVASAATLAFAANGANSTGGDIETRKRPRSSDGEADDSNGDGGDDEDSDAESTSVVDDGSDTEEVHPAPTSSLLSLSLSGCVGMRVVTGIRGCTFTRTSACASTSASTSACVSHWDSAQTLYH